MKFNLMIPVWGEAYVKLLNSFCLPSLLASGNLPDWKYKETTTLTFYTTPQDRQKIEMNLSFQLLKAIVSIKWHYIPQNLLSSSMKYMTSGILYRGAIKEAYEENSGIIFLPADSFISNQAFYQLEQLIQIGKEIMMVPGLKINLESTQPDLIAYKQNGVMNVSAKDAIKLFLKHMHLDSKACFIHETNFHNWPSHVYEWKEYPYKFTAHCFHLHPFMLVKPIPMNRGLFYAGIDGDYLEQYTNQLDKFALLGNQHIVVLSFLTQKIESTTYKLSEVMKEAHIKQFANRHCTSIHRWFFTQPIQLDSR